MYSFLTDLIRIVSEYDLAGESNRRNKCLSRLAQMHLTGGNLEKCGVICVGYGVWGMRWYLNDIKGGGGHGVPLSKLYICPIYRLYINHGSMFC